MKTKRYPVTIYYEDTDVTGIVYHANYLKYLERARSEYLGTSTLRHLQFQEGIRVVVYCLEIMYKKGATLGDQLEITSQPEMDGKFRIIFHQKVFRVPDQVLLTTAKVELVCLAKDKLTPIPNWIVSLI